MLAIGLVQKDPIKNRYLEVSLFQRKGQMSFSTLPCFTLSLRLPKKTCAHAQQRLY